MLAIYCHIVYRFEIVGNSKRDLASVTHKAGKRRLTKAHVWKVPSAGADVGCLSRSQKKVATKPCTASGYLVGINCECGKISCSL